MNLIKMFWLSFADRTTGDFIGVAILEDLDYVGAVVQAKRRQLLPPNSDVVGFLIPACSYETARPYKNRLLRLPELERAFGVMITKEQVGSNAIYLHTGCLDAILNNGEKPQ